MNSGQKLNSRPISEDEGKVSAANNIEGSMCS